VSSLRAPRHVRIFLASPGDVLEERQAARELLHRLEREPLVRRDFTLEAVSWDDPDAPAPMLATLTPQQAVVRALPRPSQCDLTILILWGRIGTPLDERKPDGTPYASGSEWEFEDARRAGRPILVYRRTTPLPPATDDDTARQHEEVARFFARFTGPGGVLTGGYATYDTLDAFTTRLRKDVESLLPTLAPPSTAGESLVDDRPPEAGRLSRLEARIRRWSVGRFLLVLAGGASVTTAAAAAVAGFSMAMETRDPPLLAHLVRALLAGLAVVLSAALIVISWWWFGRRRVE
jgi:hypothetical protein